MIDEIRKQYSDLCVALENAMHDIQNSESELKARDQSIIERQNKLKLQEETNTFEKRKLEMEKSFLATVRDQQKVKDEELKILDVKRLNLNKDQEEFNKKKEEFDKKSLELEGKIKQYEFLEVKFADLEKREKMIEREKLIDKERKEFLDKRDENIKLKEQKLQRLAEL
jgi:hypothetical protein